LEACKHHHIRVPAFTASDHLHDLGVPSIVLADLVFAIETEFKLEIPDAEMVTANFRTVAAMGAMVQRLGSGKPEESR
jgi:acyl carrier protein